MKGDKEKRLKEAEKIRAEVEIRKAEVESKKWGSIIEEIQRKRKTPQIRSLTERIAHHLEEMRFFALNYLLTGGEFNMKDTSVLSHMDNLIDTYRSIREDLRGITKMGQENLEKIFPGRKTNFKTNMEANAVLMGFAEQEMQIKNYVIRLSF